jgi:polar amino acid transport system substrate-binding protein
MKKRLISVLGVISAGALLLAGCGSAGSASGSTASAAPAPAAQTEATDTAASTDAAPEVTVIHCGTGGHTRPWTYTDDNDELIGYDIEIVKEVFNRLPQYEVEFEIIEFASIFTGMDAGNFQMGANNFSMNEERKAKYLFSTPKVISEEVLLSSTIEFTKDRYTLDELTQYVYTAEPGSAHTTEAEKYNDEHPDNQITINYTEEDVPTILTNVQSGKYELFSTAKPMYFGAYKDQLGLDLNYAILDWGKGPVYSYFLFAKGQEQLQEDFDAVLAELVADGTLKAISEKYIGEDLTPYEAYN